MINPETIEIHGLSTIHKLCKFGADHNMEGCSFTEIVERMFAELAKSQAVREGRTDIQIIEQTIGIVRLIGESNSFECANSKVFPFESKSPRLQVWWRVACEIQELLTDTDPNNCDFEEYRAMVEAQEQSHE